MLHRIQDNVIGLLVRNFTAGMLLILLSTHGASANDEGTGTPIWLLLAAVDSDFDGVPNKDDAFPRDPSETRDSDDDGIGDVADLDDDNDGVVDSLDAFPLDPFETLDTDLDGIGNAADLDDDGDGYEDVLDWSPLDSSEWLDSDGDGVGNNRDSDDDNDGLSDAVDSNPLVSDLDSDNDGLPDRLDVFPNNPGNTTDGDGDGVFDLFDTMPARGDVSKALRFQLQGVASAGVAESLSVNKTAPQNPNDTVNKGLTDLQASSDGSIDLVEQTNVISWDDHGQVLTDVILSSETTFVAESILTPDATSLYLLTGLQIQQAIEAQGIQNIDLDMCRIYKVDTTDNTFVCLLDNSGPELNSVLGSDFWRDDYLRGGLSFRADGVAVAETREGPALIFPDGQIQYFNQTDRQTPPGYLKDIQHIVWLDDEHIAVTVDIFPEQGGEVTSYLTAFNVENGLEVAEVEASTFRGVKHQSTLYTSGNKIRWTGSDFEIEESGAPVQDTFGNLWFRDFDYGLTLTNVAGDVQVSLGEDGTSGPNIYLGSSSGLPIVYQDYAFTDGWILAKYSRKARFPVTSIEGNPYQDSEPLFVSLDGAAGSFIKLSDPDLWYYLRSGNEQEDVVLAYEVSTSVGTEVRELVIPIEAINSFAAYDSTVYDPSGYQNGYELLEEQGLGVALELPNPESEQSTFCLYQLATRAQRCADLTDFEVKRTDFENIRNNAEAHFPRSYYALTDPERRALPGVQNLVFGGEGLIAYFKDSADHQYYRATADLDAFMLDGDDALNIERVINGAGESEVIARTSKVRPGIQQRLSAMSLAYDRGRFSLELDKSLSSVVAPPNITLVDMDTMDIVSLSQSEKGAAQTQIQANVVDKAELRVTEYEVRFTNYFFVAGSSLRYGLSEPLYFTMTQALLSEDIDTDSDGIGNSVDEDDDGDGYLDGEDAFPLDSTEHVDTDGDGLGNNQDPDDDGDGVNDVFDLFPLDPTEAFDQDGDGIGDNADRDADGDGVVDAVSYTASVIYGDIVELEVFDVDDSLSITVRRLDQQVLNQSVEFGSARTVVAIDSLLDVEGGQIELALNNNSAGYTYGWRLTVNDETVLDFACGDFNVRGCDDNDDTSGLVRRDLIDIAVETPDTDSDGVADYQDAFPLDPAETTDTDSDQIGDNADPDDDNDGVEDEDDAFPLDPDESLDTDGDGVGNNADGDDDNDGVVDSEDAFSLDPAESVDTDGDGIGDNQDRDADGDGQVDPVAYAIDVAIGEQLDLVVRDVDDDLEVVVYVSDSEVFRQSIGFGAGETVIDLSSAIGSNSALIDLSLSNDTAGYTYSWVLLADDQSVVNYSCGDFNVSGCDEDSTDAGVVRRDQIEITQRAVDTDQDGLDDYTDSDDDNDGIPDGSDADTLGTGTPDLFTALSAGDISSYTLIAGAQSAVDIPSSKSGENLFVAELYPDGSLEMVGYRVEGTGSWAWSAADQSLFVSVSREENIQVSASGATDNIDLNAYEGLGNPEVTARIETDWTLVLTSEGQFEDHWLMPTTKDENTYVLSSREEITISDFVADTALPVRTQSEPAELATYVPLTQRTLPFDSTRVVGTWGFNSTLPGAKRECVNATNYAVCGHLFTFLADGKGEASGRSYTWQIGDDGSLVLDFDDGSGSVAFSILRDHSDNVLEVLARTQSDQTLSTVFYSLGVKQNSSSVASVIADQSILDTPLINGNSVSDPKALRRLDGVPSETFGFLLNSDGSLDNFDTYGLGSFEPTKLRDGVWTQSEHLIEMSYCVFQSGFPLSDAYEYSSCGQSVEPYYGLYRFERDWDLLDVEIDEAAGDQRYYVLEKIRLLSTGSPVAGTFAADFTQLGFGGVEIDAESQTYTVPTSAEDWAGFANIANDIYPLAFPEGGSISFTASAEMPTSVRFRFEYEPYPEVEPAYDTEFVLVDSSDPEEYTIEVPSQGVRTFSSVIMYIAERDQPVMIRDVRISATGPRGESAGDQLGLDWVVSRINFYEPVTDYDFSDSDSDGVPNTEDSQPLNPEQQ